MNRPGSQDGDAGMAVSGVSQDHEHEPLGFLDRHPLASVRDLLGEYLGIGADSLSLLMFLSRAAGRLGVPFNLAIYSDDAGAEHLIADRIINLAPEGVRRSETIRQFRELAETGFEDTDLILVRSLHEGLFRFACESACRDLSATAPPSVWLITDERTAVNTVGPTIPLLARQTDRSLAGFGHCFSTTDGPAVDSARESLRQLVLSLKNRRPYRCPFQQHLRASLKPFQMLVTNRLLSVIAALRIELHHLESRYLPDSQMVVTVDDYRVTRELLLHLPIPGEHSNLSPYAAETGAKLFDAVSDPSYQLTIPDNSRFGSKGFTRRFAEEATGLSYNTIKDHLGRLESEGIIESLMVSGHQKHSILRGRGRQIYFRFVKNRSPPFGINTPFGELPTPETIAAVCTSGLQSQSQAGSPVE